MRISLQRILLVVLVGVAVLYFRYNAVDHRLTPSLAWDALLWLSSAGLVVVGFWTVWQKLASLVAAAL